MQYASMRVQRSGIYYVDQSNVNNTNLKLAVLLVKCIITIFPLQMT
jgi:hypothetical protein